MLTRHAPAVLLAVVGYAAVSMAFAQTQSSHSPPPQSQAGASGQASGESAAHAGSSRTQLAGDSSVNAVLTTPVDSRRSKPGDAVRARTTQPVHTDDGRFIPTGSTLVGHVSEAHARAEGQTGSALGIVFDEALTKDGGEIPLRNVGIRALAAAEGAAAGSIGGSGMTMGGSGVGAGGMPVGHSGGGGLLGRTTGTVAGTVGGELSAVGGTSSSLAASTGGALQAGPGAAGGLDASGLLTGGSSGVFGLCHLSLATAGSGAAGGSLVTSPGKNVHLDQGTRLLLSSQAGTSDADDRESHAESSRTSGLQPDRR